MKNLALSLLLAVVLHTAAAAQNQPDVEVVKSGWRKLAHKTIPSGKKTQEMRNVQRDAQIAEEYRKQPRDRDYGTIIRLQQEKKNQMTPLDQPDPTNKDYEYKFRFKNKGAKVITGLLWVYVFRDANTQKPLLAHGFNTDAIIKPGKEKSVTAYTDSGPPRTVNADAQQKQGKAWNEEVIITAVVYADGSKWERK
jgi:hypothetical protein